MVKILFLGVLSLLGVLCWAQSGSPVPSASPGPADGGTKEEKSKGPALYGDGGGRIFRWEDGQKTWLTPEGQDLTVGGVGEKELWGLAAAGGRARFFTLERPKKKDPKTDTTDKAGPKKAAGPRPAPRFDRGDYPVPDLADRVGDRLLLVYGALSGHPRYEVWQAGVRTASRAWDDGRVAYALALGPKEGWIVAGRTSDGSPWLEVSGKPEAAPEGWRGRLTVAAWVPEVAPDKKSGSGGGSPGPKGSPAPPPPVHPWAAGWGAPGNGVPRALFWGPDGWTQPAPDSDSSSGGSGTYPVLGTPGDQGTLTLAGWRADGVTGAKQPWFWDGSAASVPGGSADGEPQAFSLGGKGGAVLVVKHLSAPWFTLEDGKASVPLEGLDAGDRVAAIQPADEAKKGGDSAP